MTDIIPSQTQKPKTTKYQAKTNKPSSKTRSTSHRQIIKHQMCTKQQMGIEVELEKLNPMSFTQVINMEINWFSRAW